MSQARAALTVRNLALLVTVAAIAVLLVVPSAGALTLTHVRSSSIDDATEAGTPQHAHSSVTNGRAPSRSPSVNPAVGPPTVSSTFVLFNDSLVSGNFLAQYGTEPQDVAFDSSTGDLFVSDFGTDSVSIIGSVPSIGNEVIHVVDVGEEPEGIVYDAAQHAVYVADWGDGTVDVINDSTYAVGSITVGGQPISLAYDPHDGTIYVANWATTEVDIINDTTNVVGSPITGIGGLGAGSPDGIVFDSGTDQIFVANDYRPFPATSMPVNVINDSTNTVNATVWVGNEPDALAYDSLDNYVWVANSGSNNISAISDSNDTVFATYGGFSTPDGIAWSPYDECVYVSNSGANNVSTFFPGSGTIQYNTSVGGSPGGIIFSNYLGTNLIVVANNDTANVSIEDDSSGYIDYTVALAASPLGVAYDSFSNEVFVSNYGRDGTVSVLNDSRNTLSPISAIDVGRFPIGIVFDPHDDDIYVANSGSDSVSVIADSDNMVITTITVGTNPWGLAYDPAQDEILVVCNGDAQVDVINGTFNDVVDTLQLPSTFAPEGIAFDGASGMAYVADYAGDNVAVIDPVQPTQWVYFNSLASGVNPGSVVYDSIDNEVFVSNAGTNNVTVYTQPTRDEIYEVKNISTGSLPTGLAYDSAADAVFVAEAGSDALDAISGASNSVVGGVSIGGEPYGIAVDAGHNTLYAANFRQGTVTILNVSITGPAPTVTFAESGLPSGATWYVNVTGQTPLYTTIAESSGTTLEIQLTAGPYDYTAATNWSNRTTASPGMFTVASSDIQVGVPFGTVLYAISVEETGLASGASWWLNTSGGQSVDEAVSTGSGTLGSMKLPNGSYSFTTTTNWNNYTTPNATGNFQVDGRALTLYVEFSFTGSPPTYSVTFIQHGLPAGVVWYVNITGLTGMTATGTTLQVQLATGNYQYSASSNSVAYRSPPADSFTVASAGLEVNLTYTDVAKVLYSVDFVEAGLPSGTNWSISITSVAEQSATSPGGVDFDLANGTYSFSVTTVTGFVSNLTSGLITVHGSGASRLIGFTSATGSSPGSNSVTATDLLIGGVVTFLLIAAMIWITVALYRSRKKKEPQQGGPKTGPDGNSPVS
jgi:YVTN family beta-propeller protein